MESPKTLFIDLTDEVAEAAQVEPSVASRVISFFDKGFTVPFIARYRKEATGGLQPTVLHRLKEKINDCRLLMEKIDKSLQYFNKKGLMTDELSRKLRQCRSADEVKLITEPLKPKGPRTLSARARALDLEPLALKVLNSKCFVDLFKEAPPAALKTFKSQKGVEEAVQHIISDIFAKDLELIRKAEQLCTIHSPVVHTTQRSARSSSVKPEPRSASVETHMEVDSVDLFSDLSQIGSSGDVPRNFAKDDLITFKNYLKFSRPVSKLHAHQILAINRAVERGVISIKLVFPVAIELQLRRFVEEKYLPNVHPSHLAYVHGAFNSAWKRLIEPHVARIVKSKLTTRAQDTSLEVFTENLRRRLMTAPLRASSPEAYFMSNKENDISAGVISSSSAAPGDRLPVVGLDPGWRHGCKWAACDPHGDLLATGIVWPPTTIAKHQRASQHNGLAQLTATMQRHNISTIALGNGQGSRQTGLWLAELITIGHFYPLSVRFAVVSEAGASWYSASPLADSELPTLDVSFRGAVSIARRLQDPLSELVKVDPKHLGVGMYQHDLSEKRLINAVNGVMEECISFVGVDLNAAPLHILSRISGLSETKAKSIVAYRSQVGLFRTREDLLKVKGIGRSTFAQCAGFVRIRPPFSNVLLDGSKDVEMISISSENTDDDASLCKPGSKRKLPTTSGHIKRPKCSRTTPDFLHFNPLDQTAVHPDTYNIATALIESLKCELTDVGKPRLREAASIFMNTPDRDERLKQFCTETYGLDTLRDIVEALRRPLDFDERQDCFLPLFHSSAMSLSDLRPGMQVSGRVENVTTFGAFCDIGVHQDAYIPRHMYPQTKQSDGLFSLRLGDRITAVVSHVHVNQGRIALEKVSVLPPVSCS
ncbi:unnamed protein product [Dicrocoelium dendriticum]|nr:unnamed protein product [Dicrocoelium dendriticum]